MDPIYLDYNATTPLDADVIAAMRPYLEEHFGNPSSGHVYGRRTKEAVERAREQVVGLLGASADEIVFTSGGTESNNFAIRGVVGACGDGRGHVITSAVEHPAVSEVCGHLAGRGCDVTVLPVDGDGLIDASAVEGAIRPETVLVTVMHANNEVGSIQPVAEVAKIARGRGVLVHTDAAQSVGKVRVNVDELGVDLLSVAGHKLYGPKGVGALYVRAGTNLERLMYGANHERGMRAGTENVLEIVGLGRACELAGERLADRAEHMRMLRDRLWDGIVGGVDDVRLNGHEEKRLPNTLSVSFRGVSAGALLAELPGIAASAGAACHADGVTVSATLAAMGVEEEYAMGTVRLSTGALLTEGEVDQAVKEIVGAVRRLRASGGGGVCCE